MAAEDSRKKRNLKCLAYIIAGVIAQTIIILLFVMLVMRIRNPKVRLASVTVSDLSVNTTSSSPSFSMNLDAKVTVKNTNFGHFKFENSTVTFFYKGTPVGKATVVKARAYARSTKKQNVTVPVKSGKVSDLKTDVDAGILKMTASARLDGKVHLLKIFKKKKSAEMNCSMDVNIETSQVQNLTCK